MSDMPMTLDRYDEYYMDRPFEVIYVNYEERIIYTSVAPIYIQDEKLFNKMMINTTRMIANRPYVLDRYEHWELGPAKGLLMARVRSNEERKLVTSYIRSIQ